MDTNFISSLKIVDAQKLSRSAKATVQASGRLGFSAGANILMGLLEKKRLLVFTTQDESKESIWAVVAPEADARGFEICKNGSYYHVKLKNFFDLHGIEYKSKTKRIVYDITAMPEQYEGMELFKFSIREIPSKVRKEKQEKVYGGEVYE